MWLLRVAEVGRIHMHPPLRGRGLGGSHLRGPGAHAPALQSLSHSAGGRNEVDCCFCWPAEKSLVFSGNVGEGHLAQCWLPRVMSEVLPVLFLQRVVCAACLGASS